MKKVLSIFVIVMLLVSSICVYAEDGSGVVSLTQKYDNEIGNLTRVYDGFVSLGGTVTPAVGNSFSTYISGYGKFAIAKMKLPQLANGEKYDKIIFSFSNGYKSAPRLFYMPGEEWDFSVSIADTGWYKEITKNTTAAKHFAHTEPIETEANTFGFSHYADITACAQKAWYEGQEYIYLAYADWNTTTNTYLPSLTDGDYVKAGLYPKFWYKTSVVTSDDTSLENTLETYKAIDFSYNVKEGYISDSGSVSEDGGNWGSTYFSGRGDFVIYKIPLPEVPHGKKIDDFILRWGHSRGSRSSRAYKMPGEDWSLPGNISSTDFYQSVINNSTDDAYFASDLPIIYEGIDWATHNSSNGPVEDYTYTVDYVDISEYASECWNKGQKNMYIAVGVWNSTVNTAVPSMTDSTFLGKGLAPKYYYSFSNMTALENVFTSVSENELFSGDEVVFKFNNKLLAATATVNGISVKCDVKGNEVIVSELDSPAYNKVVVAATDVSRNSLTYTLSFMNGYSYTAVNTTPYSIGASKSVAKPYSISSGPSAPTVWRIPLPDVPDGEKVSSFVFRLLTWETSGTVFRFIKLPGDKWDMANIVYGSGETPEGKQNIYEYVSNYNTYKANEGIPFCVDYNHPNIKKSTYVDLTRYAQQCYDRGQSAMYLAIHSTSTYALVGYGDSGFTNTKAFHYACLATEPVDKDAVAPKIVLESDTKTYNQSLSLTNVTKGDGYKFRTVLYNYTDESTSFDLYLAQYDSDGNLVSVVPRSITLSAGTFAEECSGSIYLSDEANVLKAFVWDASENTPLLISVVEAQVK